MVSAGIHLNCYTKPRDQLPAPQIKFYSRSPSPRYQVRSSQTTDTPDLS